MKPTVKVALVCNSLPELKGSKQITLLNQYVPCPGSCDLDVLVKCVSEMSNEDLVELENFNPDVVFHYGLSLGLFWPELNSTIKIAGKEVPIICDNHSINELFYTESYMIS